MTMVMEKDIGSEGPLDSRIIMVSSPDNFIPTFEKKLAPDVDDFSRPSRSRSWKMSTGGRISHGQSFLMSVWLRPADSGCQLRESSAVHPSLFQVQARDSRLR
jgi:hypothetical protein